MCMLILLMLFTAQRKSLKTTAQYKATSDEANHVYKDEVNRDGDQFACSP